MKISRQTLQILAVTAVLFIIGGSFALGYEAHLEKLPAAKLQVNQVVHLKKRTDDEFACKKIGSDKAALEKVRLVVEGMDTGLTATGCHDTDPKEQTISFLLRHVKEPKESSKLTPQMDEAVWSAITGSPLETIPDGRRLNYDILWKYGDAEPKSLAAGEKIATLRIFNSWAPLVVTFVIWVWFLLIFLGAKTALLRDPAPENTPLEKCTFSLAKTQMAWWFAIIFASFVFLWLVTGETPSLSSQALILLGISAVTTVASNGVSSGTTYNNGDRDKFFIDLLSDDNGIAIHRFQMLVMTVTLGLLFLQDVVSKLSMPIFNPSLLTLMGISAGTYVTLKIPAQAAATEAKQATAATTADTAATATTTDAAAAAAAADPRSGYTPTPT